MPLHPLTNFEIQKYYQDKPNWSVEIHCIALYVNAWTYSERS